MITKYDFRVLLNGEELRFAELFAGVGGFRLGIERAFNNQKTRRQGQEEVLFKQGSGNSRSQSDKRQYSFSSARCVFANEWDKYACQTYSARFGETLTPTDIRTINASELPDFDLLVGGFPCQAFSIAGKRRGFQDTRGTMFFEIARILQAKKPNYLLLENVKGLLNHNKGTTFQVIMETLDELGYETQWMVFNSKFFGVPQNRERVFIIGNLRGTPRPEILPIRESNNYVDKRNEQSSTTCNTITSRYYKGGAGTHLIHTAYKGEVRNYEDFSPAVTTPSGGGHLPYVAIPVLTPDRPEKRQNGRRFKENGEEMFTWTDRDKHGVAIYDDYNGKFRTDGNVGTVRPTFNNEAAGNGNKIVEGMRIRRLTPIECERLQGFPDNWTAGVSDTQRYKQMGNAVTVNVIEVIIRQMFNNEVREL